VELAAPLKSTLAWSTSHFCVLNIPSSMWISTYLKERDCSLRLDVGEQSCSERKAPSLLFALAARSKEQCSDTNHFVARDCGGATRSAESGRMNTAEINAAWMNNRLLI